MHWDYNERAGAQEFRPFGYLGFRYLEVIGAGEPLGRADVIAFARHASFPDEHAASFDSSNATLNAVWNLLRHSALYATQEQFLDTPTREKGAFLDPNTSSATMAAFDDRAMTFQALRDVARGQKRYWPDGRVNAVYPNGDGKRDIPDSTEQYVDWVWQMYETTGDLSQLASLYPVVKNISDYVDRGGRPEDRARHQPARAAAATTSTASSTGRRRCATATTWPPRRARPRTCSRSTCSASSPRWASRSDRPASRSARSSSARADAPHAGDAGAAASARRRVRRRARGERHAEQARVADRERVRAGVRARARRAGAGGRRLRRGAEQLDRRVDVRLPARRAARRRPRRRRSSPRSPTRTGPATRRSSRRARPTRGRAGTRARPATASRTGSAPTCSRSCRTTCSA